jgi:hypothetical protein
MHIEREFRCAKTAARMPVVADIDRSPHSEPDTQKTTGAGDQLAFQQRALSDCAALEFVARGEA